MYGILLESMIGYIKKVYGEDKWQLIRKSARLEQDNFSAHQVYAETIIPRLVDACHVHLNVSKEDILIALGKTYVDFISHYGYDKILKVVGRNFRDFLNGLDNIHEYLRFSYPKLKPPSFFCEQESRTGLILHYRSRRRYTGFTQYVVGLLKAVGRAFYKQEIIVSILKQESIANMVHVTFQLNFDNSAFHAKTDTESSSLNLPLKMDVFYDLFPFHILFDRELIIRNTGRSLREVIDEISGCDLSQVFSLKKPFIEFTWDAIGSRTNAMFELASIDPIRTKEEKETDDYWVDENGKKRTSVVSQDEDKGIFLRLKGQMLFVKEWDSMLFLGTAILPDLDVLFNTGLYLNDLSMHDNSRELVLAGAQQGVELKLILKQEQTRTKQLDDTVLKLEKEVQRNRETIFKLLPKELATAIIARVESATNDANNTQADALDVAQNATVFACSIQQIDVNNEDKGETISNHLKNVISFHKQIEILAERYEFYKIETTHSSFVAVGGLPSSIESVADNACVFAKKMCRLAGSLTTIKLNIGIHTGVAVYAVIGSRFPRLCIFGPTLLIAQQLQAACKSEGQESRVLVSNETIARLAKDVLASQKLESGPRMNFKNKEIITHLLSV